LLSIFALQMIVSRGGRPAAVTAAQAGIQPSAAGPWIPACAAVTVGTRPRRSSLICHAKISNMQDRELFHEVLILLSSESLYWLAALPP